MAETYQAAFAPGTVQNRTRQARAYISFMLTYSFEYLNPSPTEILLYAQCLANSFVSPATHKNYLSGAKTFVIQAGGNPIAFQSPLLQNFLKGVSRLSNHHTHQAPEIPLPVIKQLCDLLAALSPDAVTVRLMVLLGFTSFLRQSNLLYTPGQATSHHLRRADVTDDGARLWLSINSSKTIIDPRGRVAIPVPAINSKYCPVQAWRTYVLRVPLPPYAPALMLDAHRPLTPALANTYLRAALSSLQFPLAHQVTVHSLRRSGARECARYGAPEAQVMLHGTWSSSAVYSYVPKRLFSIIPDKIVQMFGH